jgi:hypothetical protein
MTHPDHRDPADPLHRALRGLPDVPAPATLEERVFAALAARAARPWWRQPVTAWPASAQAALVAVCLAIATGLTFLGDAALPGDDATLQAGAWVTPFTGGWTAIRGLGEAASAMAGAVPPFLFLGLLAAGALVAVALGGGVAAYRSLCTHD